MSDADGSGDVAMMDVTDPLPILPLIPDIALLNATSDSLKKSMRRSSSANALLSQQCADVHGAASGPIAIEAPLLPEDPVKLAVPELRNDNLMSSKEATNKSRVTRAKSAGAFDDVWSRGSLLERKRSFGGGTMNARQLLSRDLSDHGSSSKTAYSGPRPRRGQPTRRWKDQKNIKKKSKLLAPIVSHRRPLTKMPLLIWITALFVVPAAVVLLLLLSVVMDARTLPGLDLGVHLDNMANSYKELDSNQARIMLSDEMRVMGGVMGLVLTVSGIILKLAAVRVSGHIVSLFFRDKVILSTILFFVFSNVFVIWTALAVSDDFVAYWACYIATSLCTVDFLLLFPYFAYLFDFLNPEKVVRSYMQNGLDAILAAFSLSKQRKEPATQVMWAYQTKTVDSLEDLNDVCTMALMRKDYAIVSSAIDALSVFVQRYQDFKPDSLSSWHILQDWVRLSSDFISHSDRSIASIHENGTWLEWKVLRLYQITFQETILKCRDVCYLISINTRRIGEMGATYGDLASLDLSIKFFNTYLRASINSKDIRTLYNILESYRCLGEYCLSYEGDDNKGLRSSDLINGVSLKSHVQSRGLQIAQYLRYYGVVAFEHGVPFITEVVAHDLAELCEIALAFDSQYHEACLRTFLYLDNAVLASKGPSNEESLLGIRQSQAKLAAFYLNCQADEYAYLVYLDMKREPPERLKQVWRELETVEQQEFWEVNNRGDNLHWMPPERKEFLHEFFSWFSLAPDAWKDLDSQIPVSEDVEMLHGTVNLTDFSLDLKGVQWSNVGLSTRRLPRVGSVADSVKTAESLPVPSIMSGLEYTSADDQDAHSSDPGAPP